MPIFGEQGERGPTGDHGQIGQDGRDGIEGPEGIEGERGARGATGATGATGPKGDRGQSVFTQRQTLAIFLLFVVAFGTLGVRTEVQQRQIVKNQEQIAMQRYESCMISVPFIQRYNQDKKRLAAEFYKVIANKETAAKVRDVYLDLVFEPEPTVEQCGPRP